MRILLLTSFLYAAVAFAQPPGPRQLPDASQAFAELKTYLNLSDTQLTSITTAVRSAADSNRTLMEQIRTKQQALDTALKNGSTDAAAIGRAVLEIQALRKQLEANDTKMREQTVSFLSADQKNKLKALEEAEKLQDEIRQAHQLHLLAPSGGAAGPRPGGGPGGMGMPGPRGPMGPAGFGFRR